MTSQTDYNTDLMAINQPKSVDMEYGVPKGLVLVRLIFTMVNDLQIHLKCNSVLFADDSTFYFQTKRTVNN